MMTTERQQILDADNLEHAQLFERRAADAKERGDIMAANIWLRCAQRERSSIKKRLTSNGDVRTPAKWAEVRRLEKALMS